MNKHISNPDSGLIIHLFAINLWFRYSASLSQGNRGKLEMSQHCYIFCQACTVYLHNCLDTRLLQMLTCSPQYSRLNWQLSKSSVTVIAQFKQYGAT